MSFPPYPAYQDSGVEWLGPLPRGWAAKRVKHVTCSIEQGWSPQCDAFPVVSAEEWGVLKVGCVNGGRFDPEENKALPAELTPIPELAISAGDVLISRANTRALVGGAVCVSADHPNLLLCDKLYRLRLNDAVCLPQWLAVYLRSDAARGQIELAASGASQSMVNIGQGTILDLPMPLPTRDEQSRIDLSALKLTHHRMRDLGQQKLNLGGNAPAAPLTPVTESGSGQVQDKHKLRLQEIISAINDLFEGGITEGDAVAYVDSVIKTKMLESDLLRSQAAANTKEQFTNSPNLSDELMNAIMDAMAAHQVMSKQALNSEIIRARMLATLLGPGELWEALRAQME